LIGITCTGTYLAYGLTQQQPLLQTLLQVGGVPRTEEIPVPVGKKSSTGHCEYKENPNAK
jgi:hypothetical protein